MFINELIGLFVINYSPECVSDEVRALLIQYITY